MYQHSPCHPKSTLSLWLTPVPRTASPNMFATRPPFPPSHPSFSRKLVTCCSHLIESPTYTTHCWTADYKLLRVGDVLTWFPLWSVMSYNLFLIPIRSFSLSLSLQGHLQVVGGQEQPNIYHCKSNVPEGGLKAAKAASLLKLSSAGSNRCLDEKFSENPSMPIWVPLKKKGRIFYKYNKIKVKEWSAYWKNPHC